MVGTLHTGRDVETIDFCFLPRRFRSDRYYRCRRRSVTAPGADVNVKRTVSNNYENKLCTTVFQFVICKSYFETPANYCAHVIVIVCKNREIVRLRFCEREKAEQISSATTHMLRFMIEFSTLVADNSENMYICAVLRLFTIYPRMNRLRISTIIVVIVLFQI